MNMAQVFALYQNTVMKRAVQTSANPKSTAKHVLYLLRKIEAMLPPSEEKLKRVLSRFNPRKRNSYLASIRRILYDMIEIAIEAGLRKEAETLRQLYALVTYARKPVHEPVQRIYISREKIRQTLSPRNPDPNVEALWLMYMLGCRTIEIFRIKRIHKDRIYVLGKTGGRWIPLDTEEEYLAAERVRNYIKRKRITIESIRKTCRALLNIPAYNLRHLRATHMLEEGMRLEDVARKLGHRSLDSSLRYTHLLPVEYVKKEYARCFPRY